MSQAQPQFQETDHVHTLPIDGTGELARFEVGGGPGFTRKSLVELRIEGDAAASYTVEFGVDDAEERGVYHWYEDPADFSYTAATTVEDAWEQSRRYVRIWIDEAATSGAEAQVSLAYGR